MKPDAKYAVLIVSDHPVFLVGMTTLINREKELFVCGNIGCLKNTFKTIQELKPDVVIADSSSRRRNGSDIAEKIQSHFEGLPVLALSMHDAPHDAMQSILTGAQRYEQEAVKLVVRTLQNGLAGETIYFL